MLLPSAFQNNDIPTTLGKKVEQPKPVKPDPIREFERHNHDKPTTFVPRFPMPDDYVKVAKAELKRQWEESRYALKREDSKAKLDVLNQRICDLKEFFDPNGGHYVLSGHFLVNTDLLELPKIDASAVPVGKPLYYFGEITTESDGWPL